MDRDRNYKIAIDVLSDVPGESGQVNIHRNILNYLPAFRPNWRFFVLATEYLKGYYEQYIGSARTNITWLTCWADNHDGFFKRIISQELQVPYLVRKYDIDAFMCYPLPILTRFQAAKKINRHTLSLELRGGLRFGYRRFRSKYSILNSDCTIFNSQTELAYAKTNKMISHRNVVIHEAFDSRIFDRESVDGYTEIVRPSVKELGATSRNFIYVPTGLTAHKNSRLVLRAYSLLPLSLQENHTLVFSGTSDDRYFSSLLQEFKGLFDSRRVVVFNMLTHQEVAYLGSHAQIVIYPSLVETFGVPPLEMMALKKPVLLSDLDVLVEISGSGAMIFDRFDHHDLAEKMLYLLNNEKERIRLGEIGYDHSEKFSWKKNAEETALLIERELDEDR